MTIQLISQNIDTYAEQYTSAESELLAGLNRETNIKRGDAVMISGHLQGSFLQMISCMISPKNVLEIGTFTGYSAICLAEGLQADGHLHTIDHDEELETIGAKYMLKAGLKHKVTQHIGKAAQIIPTLQDTFDLVFIDADKVNYSLYYDLVFDKVPVGGFIVADNVLYEGEVLLPASSQSKNAKAIHEFNQKIKDDPRIQHFLLPLRDGLMIIRKVNN